MWRDYVGLVAPTAAIINGFIAVVVAQFYKDHPVAKVLLVGMAGVLGVAAIGATFYGQYKVVSEKTADATGRRDIQESLGSFIQVGNELMRRCADPTQELPLEEPISGRIMSRRFYLIDWVVLTSSDSGMPLAWHLCI
jgi:hypothetical protein